MVNPMMDRISNKSDQSNNLIIVKRSFRKLLILLHKPSFQFRFI